MTTKASFESFFLEAKVKKAKFIGVSFKLPTCKEFEVIINPIANFDTKFEYYRNAYDDNMCLKANPEVQIKGIAFGNNFDEIQRSIIGG